MTPTAPDALPRLLALRPHGDARGALVSVEDGELPFTIRRAFWIRDVPSGAVRGGHTHLLCHELVIAVAGTLTVHAGDAVFQLDRPDVACHIPPGHRVSLHDFSPDAVCLVLASESYDPADHIQGG